MAQLIRLLLNLLIGYTVDKAARIITRVIKVWIQAQLQPVAT